MSGSLVVIGNFDGVHRGHQAVLHAVARIAKARGLAPRLLTFDPHPAVTLGRRAPALLTGLERKRQLVDRACPGIEVVVREFTRDFASQTPEQFAEQVLRHELDTRLVMVGSNFRFGRGRSGGIHDLERLGRELGFDTMAEPLETDTLGAWSSTRIRGLIAAGEVVDAATMLGRPHMLSGTVVHGLQRGRTIGFPTCNLAPIRELLPPFGVYAVAVDCQRADGRFAALAGGVANLGLRPTFDDTEPKPSFEAHLFDIDQDLYDRCLRVHLVARLRDERRFAGLQQLKEQIAADCARARELLAKQRPDPAAAGAWW